MAITQNTFTTANSTTTEFDFTFPYLEQDDVKVRVDGTDTTAFTFVNATRIKLNTAPASGKKVIVYRNTSNDIKKASFYPGSAIKAEDLNSNADQLLYAVQEIDNNALSNLGEGELKQSDVGIASDFGVKLEGATTDGNFTTLKAKAQTTNRVIRLPDAAGTLVVSALDDNTIQTANIANDAIDSTKLADNAVNSEHYVDGSIDLAHMSSNSIDSDQYVDGSIDHAHLSGDCIDGDNIQDNCINSEHYVDYSIDHVHLAADCVDGDNIADDSIGAEHIERLDNHLLFGDDKYAKFGASDDFVIGHSSGDNYSYIQENNTGGGLRIKAEDLLLEDTSGDNYLYAIHDGAVKLYYDNSEKLATTSTGVSIAGNSSINGSLDLGGGLFIGGSDHYIYQDSADRLIFRVGPSGGTHTYGSMAVRSGVFTLGSASGDVHIEVGNETTPDTALKCRNNNAVELYYDNSKKFETFSNGITTHGSEIRFQNPGGTVALEVGNGATGDNYAFIDLIGDTTYADYGSRFLRAPGANGDTMIRHRGTGQLAIVPEESDVRLYYWNVLRFQTSNGGVYTTGTASESGSDIRLKENIVNITGAVSKVKQLQGFNYNFNSIGQGLGLSNKLEVGLSAQDVEKVAPEVVSKIPDTDYLTIKYERLVPLLIESIKELSAEVETLKTQVASLTG